MPKYQVTVHGKNFLIDTDGRTAKLGFLTHRYLEAADASAAEYAAVQKVRETERLRQLVRNAPNDPPVMDVDAIVELSADAELPPDTGFIFYEMNPRRWWQFWRRRE